MLNGMTTRHAFIDVEGVTREYELVVPEAKRGPGGELVPLVIALHGAGGGARSVMRLSGLNGLADRHGFLAAYPVGTGRKNRVLSWNAGHCCGFAKDNGVDDVGFIARLIDTLLEEQAVDPGRVFVVGISNGAMLAHRLGAELSAKIAAFAAIAGTLPPGLPDPGTPLSLIMFHGTADRLVPYEGGTSSMGLFRHGPGEAPVHTSVADTIAFWIDRLNCSPTPDRRPMRGGRTEIYRNTRDGCEVVLHTIDGGGHTWPGTPVGNWRRPSRDPMAGVQASRLIWEFFASHPRRDEVLR